MFWEVTVALNLKMDKGEVCTHLKKFPVGFYSEYEIVKYIRSYEALC